MIGRTPLSQSLCWVLLLVVSSLSQGVVLAEDEAVQSEDTWISAVAWADNSAVIGARSQGLLFRPAQVVAVNADKPKQVEVLGDSETSLWTVTPHQAQVLATDYRGGIHSFAAGEVKTLDIEARWIRAALAVSPDELVLGTEDGKLIFVDMTQHKELKRVDAHTDGAVFDIAISPDGKQLATASGGGKIKLFSWPELQEQASMSIDEQAIWTLTYSQDGKQLVSGGAGRRLQLWDVSSATPVVTICRSKDWITDLVSLPDSSVVVAGCMDGRLLVADYDSMSQVTELKAAESGVWAIDLSPDAKRIAMGTRKNGLVIQEVGDWVAKAKVLSEELAKVRPPSPAAQ